MVEKAQDRAVVERVAALEAGLRYFGKDQQLPADTWLDKYALKNRAGDLVEGTPDLTMERMAKAIGAKAGDGIWQMLMAREFIPAGRILFGLGNPYHNVTLKNCYVVPISGDSLDAIFQAAFQAARIYSRGGGVGMCLSPLRPEGARVNNAAIFSSGSWSFSEIYSAVTGTIGQCGRRGALMLQESVEHPDCEPFIRMKDDVRPEWLARAQGDKEFENWISERRFSRFANVSVQLTDRFLRALDEGKAEFEQVFTPLGPQGDDKHPIEPFTRTVNPQELWKLMIQSALRASEPGLIFWDSIKRESPSDAYADLGYGVICTNPCWAGDTLVSTIHGPRRFDELAREGKDVDVFCLDPGTGRTRLRTMRNPRWTGRKKVLKLTVDLEAVGRLHSEYPGRFQTYRLTEDHLVYVWNDCALVKKRAGDLVPGDRLVAHQMKRQARTGRDLCVRDLAVYRPVYRLIMEKILDRDLREDEVVHHKDGDHFNDAYGNLEVKVDPEHKSHHAKQVLAKCSSHPGAENGRWIDVTDEALVQRGVELLHEERFNRKIWRKDCLKTGYPQHLDPRFGSWSSFQERVIEAACPNHVVVSIKEEGEADVFNGTVDEFHNYFVCDPTPRQGNVVTGFLSANCGEMPLAAFDACNLGSIHLGKFVVNSFREDARVDWIRLEVRVRCAVRFLDQINTIEAEENRSPLPQIAKANLDLRRIGLGVMGLAEMLIRMRIKYGSPASIDFVDNLFEKIAIWAYDESVELSKKNGPFRVFLWEKHKEIPFIKRLPEKLQNKIRRYGLRNVTLLSIAPTGSISIIGQTSGGIEPYFQFELKRKVYKGGDKPVEYVYYDPIVAEFRETYRRVEKVGPESTFDLPDYFVSAYDIDWEARVKLQATVQKWIDNSISSTVNLPATATFEDVKKVFVSAWKAGCKGITVYVKGSRQEILSDDVVKGKEEPKANGDIPLAAVPAVKSRREAPRFNPSEKRTEIRANGRKVFVHLGLDPESSKPIEIFLRYGKRDPDLDSLAQALGTLASVALQDGMAPELIAKCLRGVEAGWWDRITIHEDDKKPVLVKSVPDAMALMILRYLEGERKGTFVEIEGASVCEKCGQRAVVPESGCQVCKSCGNSRCL